MKHDGIAVVDFGGQYAHLIATKVRRLQVYAEILQPEDPAERFAQFKGIILSGSPSLSAVDEDSSSYDKRIYDLTIPILGFCYGHQEIAKQYGGKVEHTQREYGAGDAANPRGQPIFRGLQREETVWMSHGDTVTVCPTGVQRNRRLRDGRHRTCKLGDCERFPAALWIPVSSGGG